MEVYLFPRQKWGDEDEDEGVFSTKSHASLLVNILRQEYVCQIIRIQEGALQVGTKFQTLFYHSGAEPDVGDEGE
jgi:hypothetical protein